ncbi:MAG: hypothetical protein ACR2P0_12670 [Acidimicrobiales bacterium]
MLSSIHPFGERSRNNRFALTASAHVVSSAVGGALLGLTAGAIGWLTTLIWSSTSSGRAFGVAIAAAVAFGFEATGRERLLPTRTRQVNENWIQTYRGWVYGSAFGAELGFGVSTIITTALIHVLVATIVLVGSLPVGVGLGTLFGAVRGATLLTAYRVDSVERLRAFHGSLDRMRRSSRTAAVIALGFTSVLGWLAAVG